MDYRSCLFVPNEHFFGYINCTLIMIDMEEMIQHWADTWVYDIGPIISEECMIYIISTFDIEHTALERYTWKASIAYFSYTPNNHACLITILGNLLLKADIWSAARISTKVQHYFWLGNILSIQLHIWLTVVSRLLT